MISIESMSCQQEKNDMEALRCMHSVVCQDLAADWRNIWEVPNLDIAVESFNLMCSPEVKVKKLRHDELFLCATQSGGVVSLLFTVTKRQKNPICSLCPSPKCKCYKMYLSEKHDRQAEDDVSHEDDWPSSGEECEGQRIDHYQDDLPFEDYNHRYGYNTETILYPIHDDPRIHAVWLQRANGKYEFPAIITSVFDRNILCGHGNGFDPDDNNLVLQSSNIVVYMENIDAVHESKTYSRPTVGDCRCKQQASGHQYLLWHVGNGKMVDYLMIFKYMHNWRSSGFPMYSLFQ